MQVIFNIHIILMYSYFKNQYVPSHSLIYVIEEI